jgi:hypothetical protein
MNGHVLGFDKLKTNGTIRKHSLQNLNIEHYYTTTPYSQMPLAKTMSRGRQYATMFPRYSMLTGP